MDNTNDLWRDPIWQSLGVIVAIIFGIVTLLLGLITIWISRRRKALTYKILSLTPLATIYDDIGGRVQITLDGKPVADVQLALVKVTNSGNTPIESTDYERPIRFDLSKAAQILSAGITETSSKSLKPSIEHDHTSVVIKPILLNNGDSITLKILAANFNGSILVDGRISGVAEIKEQKDDKSDFQNFSIKYGSLVSAITVSIYVPVKLLNVGVDNSFFTGALIAGGGFILTGVILKLYHWIITRRA